jgi:hypothetical protein
LITLRHQGARDPSPAVEEKAKPCYEWSGWRKKGTQTISLFSLTNFVSEVSFTKNCQKSRAMSRKK